MHAAGHQLLLTCLETLQRALKGRTPAPPSPGRGMESDRGGSMPVGGSNAPEFIGPNALKDNKRKHEQQERK